MLNRFGRNVDYFVYQKNPLFPRGLWKIDIHARVELRPNKYFIKLKNVREWQPWRKLDHVNVKNMSHPNNSQFFKALVILVASLMLHGRDKIETENLLKNLSLMAPLDWWRWKTHLHNRLSWAVIVTIIVQASRSRDARAASLADRRRMNYYRSTSIRAFLWCVSQKTAKIPIVHDLRRLSSIASQTPIIMHNSKWGDP